MKSMNQSQPNNPLHGITLKTIIEYLGLDAPFNQLFEIGILTDSIRFKCRKCLDSLSMPNSGGPDPSVR